MDFTYLSLSVHAFIHNYLHIIQREEQGVAVQTSVLSDETLRKLNKMMAMELDDLRSKNNAGMMNINFNT